MKIIRVSAIILFVTVIAIIIDSCCEGYYYKWEYIITENADDFNATQNDSVSKDRFSIIINLFSQRCAQNAKIINSAYAAYDCWELFTKKDSIVSIELITMHDLNENYPAGTDVVLLFEGYYNAHQTPSYQTSMKIDKLIENVNLEDYEPIDNILLELKNKDINEGSHQFIVNIKLSNNTILTDTTPMIKIY